MLGLHNLGLVPFEVLVALFFYLNWQFLYKVFAVAFSLIILKGHASGPLSINVPRHSILLDEGFSGRILNFENLAGLANAQVLLSNELDECFSRGVADRVVGCPT